MNSNDTAYPSGKDVEAAWSEEIKRRVAEIDSGAVELVSWEDVRAELFGQASPIRLRRINMQLEETALMEIRMQLGEGVLSALRRSPEQFSLQSAEPENPD